MQVIILINLINAFSFTMNIFSKHEKKIPSGPSTKKHETRIVKKIYSRSKKKFRHDPICRLFYLRLTISQMIWKQLLVKNKVTIFSFLKVFFTF